jgi:hypothetical protein
VDNAAGVVGVQPVEARATDDERPVDSRLELQGRHHADPVRDGALLPLDVDLQVGVNMKADLFGGAAADAVDDLSRRLAGEGRQDWNSPCGGAPARLRFAAPAGTPRR